MCLEKNPTSIGGKFYLILVTAKFCRLKHTGDNNIIILSEARSHTHTNANTHWEMSSLWPIVCELMFRRRQNGLLGVETPSFNSFLSSHAMCERKKACACVCLCLCALAQKGVQVLKLWTRSISWRSALSLPPRLIQSIFHAFISSSAFFITSYFQLHHLVSRSCSQLFLLLLSLFPILSSALLSCLPWTHHGLTFSSKAQFPLPLQMWIIFSWNFFLSVAAPLSGDIRQHHSQLLSFHLCAFQTPTSSTQFNSAWFIECLLQSQLSSGALPVLTWTSTQQVLWSRPCLRTAPPSLLHRSCWTYVQSEVRFVLLSPVLCFWGIYFSLLKLELVKHFCFCRQFMKHSLHSTLFFFFFVLLLCPDQNQSCLGENKWNKTHAEKACGSSSFATLLWIHFSCMY